MPSRDAFLRPFFGAAEKKREEQTRVTKKKNVPSLMDIFSTVVESSIELEPPSFNTNLFKRRTGLICSAKSRSQL